MGRPITLWSESDATQLWATLKGWRDAASAGVPLSVEVKRARDKRTAEQNKRYWAVLEIISVMGEMKGQKFSRDGWHMFFKDMFLPKTDGPFGLPIIGSTTDLDIDGMTEYMFQVESWACGKPLEIEFPPEAA